MILSKKERRLRRAVKTRARIEGLDVARLSVHRTPRHIYAQVTTAAGAKVIAAASTVQEGVRSGLKGTGNVGPPRRLGAPLPPRPRQPGSAGWPSTVPDSGSTGG